MYTPTHGLLTGLARTGPWHGWPAPLAGTRGPRFRLRPSAPKSQPLYTTLLTRSLYTSNAHALHHGGRAGSTP